MFRQMNEAIINLSVGFESSFGYIISRMSLFVENPPSIDDSPCERMMINFAANQRVLNLAFEPRRQEKKSSILSFLLSNELIASEWCNSISLIYNLNS